LPVLNNPKNRPQGTSECVELKGGGKICVGGFPHGVSLFQQKNSVKFDAELMAKTLFGNCPKNSICINRPTLHHEVDLQEVEAFHNESFLNHLKAKYNLTNPNLGWSILIAPSVQHFVQNEKERDEEEEGEEEEEVKASEKEKENIEGNHKVHSRELEKTVNEEVIFDNHKYKISGEDFLLNEDEQCGGSGHYFNNAQNTGDDETLCKPQVCAPARDRALSSLLKLKLPLAILSGDMQFNHGHSHIIRPPETFMKHDCTHWCAPGMSDAVLSTVLSLITLYDGEHALFYEKMKSSFSKFDAAISIHRLHREKAV
jgi:hypothetical protein